MDPAEVAAEVAKLFRRGEGRSVRVGLEHELVVVDRCGAPVPIGLLRRATTHGSAYVAHLGFEPGGQVELSLPPAPDARIAAARLHREVEALRADCAAVGVELLDDPVDVRDGEVPLQLVSERYRAMQRHFDTIGPAGRRMMRRTASTQVCLDWWPGADGLEQWRLLNLAGPFLAAAFARSTGPRSRLATWLAVDPGRTAFDGRLLSGPCPMAAYGDLAETAHPFLPGSDVVAHLTTLFPPVRPRGTYLEVRFLDAQPAAEVGDVAGVLSALLYDDALRSTTLAQLEPEASRIARLWRGAALGDPLIRARGRALADAARAVFSRTAGAA